MKRYGGKKQAVTTSSLSENCLLADEETPQGEAGSGGATGVRDIQGGCQGSVSGKPTREAML